jgi:TPR repeat protein
LISARRDEVLLLYYSGHGRLDVSNTLYLCTQDTVADELISTSVSSQQIGSLIEHSSAARTVIILDCCHSGAFKSGDLARPLAGLGRYVLTSCRDRELANDASAANKASLFTEYLVAGLRRGVGSQPTVDHLTIEDLHRYVFDQLHEHGRQRPQFIAHGEMGLAIARRPRTSWSGAPGTDSASLPGLVLSETKVDLGKVAVDEVVPVERIYVTARRRDGTPAEWTATASADWVHLKQGADPDRIELTVSPRLGGTRANVEVCNKDTGDAKTVRLMLQVVSAPRLRKASGGQPKDGERPARRNGDPAASDSLLGTTPAGPAHDVADPTTMIDLGALAEQRGDIDEAERWYQRAADAGDAEGMNLLGLLLHERRHNTADATRWFRQAVDNGSTDAMVNLGVLGADRDDLDEAETWYSRAAKAGSSEGMVHLGLLLADRDAELAQRWFRRAADLDDPLGMLHLGLLAMDRENFREADLWFNRAAEAGNTDAMVSLGELARARDDSHEARRHFLRAADAGEPEGMFSLGFLALDQEKDDEAERWFRRAADAGHGDGMAVLGWLALNHGNVDEARRWFRQAIAAESTSGMVGLGTLAQSRSDYKKAGRWFRKAADAGNTDGMVQLGALLQSQGSGDEAERWFRAAADTNDTDAMVHLAALLQSQGRGDEAERWIRTAADAGHTDAMDRLTAQVRKNVPNSLFPPWQPGHTYPTDATAYEIGYLYEDDL